MYCYNHVQTLFTEPESLTAACSEVIWLFIT